MGRYLSIAIGRTYERGFLVPSLIKNVLLRVGGGMECPLVIALSRHSEKEFFVCFLDFIYCIAIEWVLVIPR